MKQTKTAKSDKQPAIKKVIAPQVNVVPPVDMGEDLLQPLPAAAQPTQEEPRYWFIRKKKGILTASEDKKEMPEGVWTKCPSCNHISTTADLKEKLFVCSQCSYHHRIGSDDYYAILFDNNEFESLFNNIRSTDFLHFTDLQSYQKRLDKLSKTNINDSMSVATGLVGGEKMVIACMDFEFIGGSLGSVMGERFARAVDYCIKHRMPYVLISKSGGARMMESAYSLMQMPKTSAKLTQLSSAKLPFISILTDPTFGGVTASFAMLGDLNIAEPGALIGFAGPRIIKEITKKDLPEGFQKSEFLLEHGFLDLIIDRREMKNKLAQFSKFLKIENKTADGSNV